MNQIVASEYFDTIFKFLSNNKDLHSCLLVNKHWATCAVPILWEAPFRIKDKKIPSSKVIQVYLAFIPDNTFLKLGYEKRIGLMISKPLFFNYPSFLKELSYDQFLNAAIANKCCKDIIIELFKILAMNSVRLRRFDIYNYLNCYSENLNNIGSLILPHFSESISIFARDCHNIKNLK
ncbi:10851_t:CDS:2, partial [Dentiscutata heterogama]